MSAAKADGRMLLGSLALMIAFWGVLGWFDLAAQAEAGFNMDGKHVVKNVESNSPAAEAGLLAGDQVLSIAGYVVEDARSLARLPRMKAGDTREFTLLREGVEQVLAISYAPVSQHKLELGRAVIAVGFCFLLFPLLALFRVSSDATRILAVMGLGLSLAFLRGPYLADASIRAMTASISMLFALFGMAALLQFLLIFPNRRPYMDKTYAKAVIYLPAAGLWFLLAWRLMFTPTASGGLNTLTGVLVAVVAGGYFLFALFRILRNYSQTDHPQRKKLALNLMLWGTILGLLPALLALLIKTFSPQSVLPGQDFYFMSLLLIPLAWAYSAGRIKSTSRLAME
ncbi:MAG: PDZ domain-containing protein [Xanthomonadales bacterium]|nr:PDZ domain-containing protein [Xanthomonadales bacterium]